MPSRPRQLSVPDGFWGEPRFLLLADALGWLPSRLAGELLLFWSGTRATGRAEHDDAQMQALLPSRPAADVPMADMMARYGFISRCAGAGWQVAGDERHISRLASLRARGRTGAAARARAGKRLPTRRKTKATDDAVAPVKPSVGLWDAYDFAYKSRYGVAPSRNGTVNAQAAALVKRWGAEDAPAIVGFYVNHQEPYYCRQHHSLACALRDAESLQTQWRRDLAVTSADVRAQQVGHDLAAQLSRVNGALGPL